MGNDKFEKLVKRVVAEYANKHLDKTDGRQIRTMFLSCGSVRLCRTTRLLPAPPSLTVCTTSLHTTEIKSSFTSMRTRSGKTCAFPPM